ncbi:hypothetical protein JQ608_39010 [Bradyrhizobium liaoningense]|nr:hypothetical protein [Bradyrhizobium liaoningense]MBR1002589.1 hypothetical protein [Bradyrhizobium liaoningense]MBR1068925.1 hypothetical protein [Bradyrhizobium liaoningense]
MGLIEAAISDYTDALALNNQLASAYNGRGNALRETGQVDRAIETVDKPMQ